MAADTVFSLILGRIDLRGEFCLRQNSNPLKYNICRPVYECELKEILSIEEKSSGFHCI